MDLQEKYNCIFCIVDLHAITVPENRKDLKKNTFEVLAAYLASGIDPKKHIIFNQSRVSGHSELAWILSCNTPIGWLNRMTQFKDKAGKNKEKAPLGLYSYPVLMAADILLYKATHVPVGDDQKQHLELSRDISQSFNRYYNNNFFPIPDPLIVGEATRVMSLKDGKSKMSKSDPSDQSRINLIDTPDMILKKIKKAKTDSDPFPTKIEELKDRPEISNLITIFSSVSGHKKEQLISNYKNETFSKFKVDLAETLVDHLKDISHKIKILLDDRKYLEKILNEGCERANDVASDNMKSLKEIIGFF